MSFSRFIFSLGEHSSSDFCARLLSVSLAVFVSSSLYSFVCLSLVFCIIFSFSLILCLFLHVSSCSQKPLFCISVPVPVSVCLSLSMALSDSLCILLCIAVSMFLCLYIHPSLSGTLCGSLFR